MAQSKRFRWGSRLACLAALALAFASEGRTSTLSGAPSIGADGRARVSLMADASPCRPGLVEALLDDWLDSTKNSDFQSDYAAMAFDGLVELVHMLRDIAQDFCV